MKKKLTLSVVLGLLSVVVFAQPQAPSGKRWEKVKNLSDEFNGGFDNNKWQKVLWDYAGTPTKMIAENSGVADGNLWIKATLDNTSEKWFQSSRVYSKEQIKYPMYTETRMITAHLSAFNTFWLNNGDINNRDEIDVVENNSRPSCGCRPDFPWQMNSQYFQVQGGNTERAHGNFDNRNLSANNPKKGVRWNEQYHTVGVWWIDANNMQFYLDGEPAGSVKTTRNFTRNLNLIWDLWTDDENFLGGVAVKSHLTNNNINTMKVDWVHTYKLVDGTGGGTPNPPASGNTVVIEAENFNGTGGTYDDSFVDGPGNGVGTSAIGINYVNSGDFANYNNINIPVAGDYKITYRIATPSDNAEIRLLVDGTEVAKDTVDPTGSWIQYNALESSSVIRNLSAGNHTIRIVGSGSNEWQWNLDKITLTKTGNTRIQSSSLIIEAENFVRTGGNFDDSAAGGSGSGVGREGTIINYVNNGDWAEYNVNVTVPGTYAINYLIASPSTGARIAFMVDGERVAATNVPNTGNWTSYRNVSGKTAYLTAGEHVIRIVASSATPWQWNLDKITLTTGAAKNSDSALDVVAPLFIYPNPASDSVQIQGLNSEVSHAVSIYDMKGTRYLETELSNTNTINIESLPTGIYFLNIINASSVNKTIKLVKK